MSLLKLRFVLHYKSDYIAHAMTSALATFALTVSALVLNTPVDSWVSGTTETVSWETQPGDSDDFTLILQKYGGSVGLAVVAQVPTTEQSIQIQVPEVPTG